MPRTAPELLLLACAVVVGLVQLLWAAGAARAQQDLAWAAGPRDEPMPISGVAARLDRAFRNFMETFPFFAAAALAVVFTQCTSGNNASVGGGVIADGRSGAVCSVGTRSVQVGPAGRPCSLPAASEFLLAAYLVAPKPGAVVRAVSPMSARRGSRLLHASRVMRVVAGA